MILVETSVLLPFLTGGSSAEVRHLEWMLQEDEPWCTTPFAVQEILQGARDEREWRRLQKYLSTLPLATLSADGHILAARIYFDCRRRGITVRSSVDCLIAQTALEHDLALLHDDRDFDAIARVRPLRVVDVSGSGL